ncbi:MULTISPECIES: response regulator transcription factor [Tenacibaculum]|uniref:Response regulator transcription factor n=1 Tax=Tenacibaculum aiptasiae TaxID=426481 RepID=A0A7J5A9C8_9FLAO|nr:MULTISPECIES: response regulator transcription factor [Tenacibaculum]KAB1154176.1 response regulator transcription factor [Tenacibaculum aiptasiae]MCF2876551.1 response regulator transcription factor [Tenacibaculum sp. Cn5-1]MCF2936542.1 response regulator transcription factor [Tenacibaculum sp. Cn5-34]MCG7511865.1 response regulator transcription factor [Tenacibaculum sp. Cn5-46]
MDYKIKVHIADDHKILIDGVIALLNTEDNIEIEGYSLTGRQVVNWSANNHADVLVLDINMPEMDGIEVLKTFKQRNTKIKTIILSSLSDPKLVQEMVLLGANGFVDKSCASDHIIDAIKTVYNGVQYFSDDIKSKLLELYMSESKAEEQEAPHNDLTEREVEVLKQIALEKSSSEIAEHLKVSIKTVETYRRNLYKKLKVKNVVGLAMYAVKNNIV